MSYDLLSVFQQRTSTYDAQSHSPGKIFTWGISQREKVPTDLEHCQLMIYVCINES